MNFKINSRSLFTIIFKLKNHNLKTRDFSPLIERVLAGVDKVFLISLLLSQVRNFSSLLLPLSGWMENMLYSVCNDLF